MHPLNIQSPRLFDFSPFASACDYILYSQPGTSSCLRGAVGNNPLLAEAVPYWLTGQGDRRRQGIPWERLALLSLEGAKGPLEALRGDWGRLIIDLTFLELLL